MGKINEKWKLKFKRYYPCVEKYYLEGSDYAIVISGSESSTAKAAVNKLREQGEKVGLLRIRVLRPFPADDVQNALKDIKKIAVIDKDISLGSSGILHSEIKSISSNFIATSRLSEKDIFDIYKRLKESEEEESVWLIT
jgi:pyruvate ferredoxin oxidoreductase alpha subunit